MKNLLIRLIEHYQRRGGGQRLNVDCNFEPTCSEYTKQSIQRFGAMRGVRLGWNRIRRCNQPDLVHRIDDPVPKSNEINTFFQKKRTRIGKVNKGQAQ